MKRFLLVAFVCLYFGGCAMGHRTSYDGRSDFKVQSDKDVIVAVHDMRPYVQNNKKAPNYVGILKSIYGIPYNVSTKSGNPLADDFGKMIVETMEYRGVSAMQMKIPPAWSFDAVKKEVIGDGAGANIYYIKMLEWKTETHFRPALHYNLQLVVLDDQANEIGNNSEDGFFYFNKDEPGKENLASAMSSILERLFQM